MSTFNAPGLRLAQCRSKWLFMLPRVDGCDGPLPPLDAEKLRGGAFPVREEPADQRAVQSTPSLAAGWFGSLTLVFYTV